MGENQEKELTYEEVQKAKRDMEKDSVDVIGYCQAGVTETTELSKFRKKYVTGKYDCYAKNPNYWEKLISPVFERFTGKEVLVLKQHSSVAEAVILNPNIEIQFQSEAYAPWYKLQGEFFTTYSEVITYRFDPDIIQKPFSCEAKVENCTFINSSEVNFDIPKIMIGFFDDSFPSYSIAFSPSDYKENIELGYRIISDNELSSLQNAKVEKIGFFAIGVYDITNALAEMLIGKNVKYGNSALKPKRIFSKASALEQILVRIDDKLSRMANQDGLDDEDVVEDLLGYLVLLKMAQKEIYNENA